MGEREMQGEGEGERDRGRCRGRETEGGGERQVRDAFRRLAVAPGRIFYGGLE